MRKSADIMILERFFKEDPIRKLELAFYLQMSSTNSIDKWISRGKLPAARRQLILDYIRGGMKRELSRAS